MTTTEILTLTNIVLTAIAIAVTYANYTHIREKDFQDNLYKTKVEAYRTLIEQCVDIWRQLDINSTPFVQIYDVKDEAQWMEYFLKEIHPLYHLAFDLQKEIFRHTTFLPSKVMDKVFEFSEECLSYITTASHFDTGLIIQRQDELHDLFFELVNTLRSDLGIELIDESLNRRIGEINNR